MNDTKAIEKIQDLQKAFKQIYCQQASSLSYYELYEDIYQLVLHKFGSRLYDGVEFFLRNYLSEVRRSLVAALVSNDNRLSFVDAILKEWDNHSTSLSIMNDLLLYLDRNYCSAERKPHVYALGLSVFRIEILENSSIKTRLKNDILEEINRERMDELIDTRKIRNCLLILRDCSVTKQFGLFRAYFEIPFLEATTQFYKAESEKALSGLSAVQYLTKADQRYKEELSRSSDYLFAETLSPTIQILDTCWIKDHLDKIIYAEADGLEKLLETHRTNEISLMYRLITRIPSTTNKIYAVVKETISKTEKQIYSRLESSQIDAKQYIEELTMLKIKYDEIVMLCFENSTECVKSIKETMKLSMNRDTQATVYLCAYIDDFIKKKSCCLSAEDVDKKITSITMLFKHVNDKDIFEDMYRRMLSKRLLRERVRSEGAEKLMIDKLKTECGCQYTLKLEQMLKDKDTSHHHNMAFQLYSRHDHRCNDSEDSKAAVTKKDVQSLQSSSMDLKVTVLTANAWPVENLITKFHLPEDILTKLKHYEEFYYSRFEGRRLKWLITEGSAILNGFIGSKNYELTCSTLQMCILLNFNLHKSLTKHKLKELTQTEDDELSRHLLSLITNKASSILKRQRTSVDRSTSDSENPHTISSASSYSQMIDTQDTFVLNHDLVADKSRIRVPLLKNNKENQCIHESAPGEAYFALLCGRRMTLKATVMRIMKSRKRLSHQDLIDGTLGLLASKFVPSEAFIRSSIDELIQDEYIERDSSDRNFYRFM